MKPLPLWWLFVIAAAANAAAAGKLFAVGSPWEAAPHAIITVWAAWWLTRSTEVQR